MGLGTGGRDSLGIEVDPENPDKDLGALDPGALGNAPLPVKPFTLEEAREIVFKLMLES